VAIAMLALATGASAESPDEEASVSPDAAGSAATEGSDEPAIDLDVLLRLPDSYSSDGERRGGATRSQWRQRFGEAAERLAEAEHEVDRLQSKLAGAAEAGGWQAGAPGLSNPDPSNNTLHFKLRQDLRRAREDLGVARRRALDLAVEADLADVPPDWRH